MPYISTEEVSVIRKSIKKQFPDYNISVVRSHYSSVNISVMAGPLQFGGAGEPVYCQVNHFWLRSSDWIPTELRFLQTISDIASAECGPSHMDGDYGSVPGYYVNITIGKWDRKYRPNVTKK